MEPEVKANYMSPAHSLADVLGRAVNSILIYLLRDSPRRQKGYVRRVFQVVNAWDKNADLTFMNYGFSPLDSAEAQIELRPEDDLNRYSIHLYQRVTGVVDLRAKDVLEVGSGRGGGSSYMVRCLEPRSMTSVDLAEKASRFCHIHYPLERLSFETGDAEILPFPASSFDAVVNVESSHLYPSMEHFLQEVGRVLLPQGYFLLADTRGWAGVPIMREQLRQSGLRILQEESLTLGVLRGMELDTQRKVTLIQRKIPRALRPIVRRFAPIQDSQVYHELRTGAAEYLRFVLQKY